MDEVEVEVVEADLTHGGLKLLERLVVVLRLGRQLRGDVDLLSRNARVAHRPSNRRLVVVGPGRVDIAVADPQGVSDGVVALVALLEQPRTEPDLGNLVSVAEGVGLGQHAHRYSNFSRDSVGSLDTVGRERGTDRAPGADDEHAARGRMGQAVAAAAVVGFGARSPYQ